MSRSENILTATCGEPQCQAKGIYEMRALCGNCIKTFTAYLTKGHPTHDARPECPVCGVRNQWSWSGRS